MSTREIQNYVAIIRVAPGGFARLAETVRSASREGVFSGPMRLLIDLQAALRDLNYRDMRSQAHALAEMRAEVAPLLAVLTTNSIAAMNAGYLFATLARIEHTQVRVFVDEDKALHWLQA